MIAANHDRRFDDSIPHQLLKSSPASRARPIPSSKCAPEVPESECASARAESNVQRRIVGK